MNFIKSYQFLASLVAQTVKCLPAVRETRVRSLGWEDPLGEGNGNSLQHSCLGNLMDRGDWWAQSMGVARLGHDLVTKQQLQLFKSTRNQVTKLFCSQ